MSSSEYKVKISGRPSLKSFDLLCSHCGYYEERSVDLRECETDEQVQERIDLETQIQCPSCEEVKLDRVWMKAPSIGGGNDRSPETIAKMKQSFHERFIKKEIDDVRHKHGRNFDDALRSSAVDKIKKGEA